jgi:hypothetical protein
MIGVFWNIRVMNKNGRFKCLNDFIKDNNLDFVGIQETKKEVLTDSSLEHINKDMT